MVTAEAGPAALATLTLRLFCKNSLLESAVIRAEVVSRFRPQVRSQFDLKKPITLAHDRIERGFDRLDDDIEHSLHIDVGRAGPGFSLRFTWKGADRKPLSLAAPISMTPDELGTIAWVAGSPWSRSTADRLISIRGWPWSTRTPGRAD